MSVRIKNLQPTNSLNDCYIAVDSEENGTKKYPIETISDEVASLRVDMTELQRGGYVADQQQIAEDINAWLDAHPEATTTVEDNSITSIKLQDGSVTTPKLHDGAVATAKVSDGAITAAKLADDSVSTDKVQDGAITSAKIATGTIQLEDLDSEIQRKLNSIILSII